MQKEGAGRRKRKVFRSTKVTANLPFSAGFTLPFVLASWQGEFFLVSRSLLSLGVFVLTHCGDIFILLSFEAALN